MSTIQATLKRALDLALASVGLFALSGVIGIALACAYSDTGRNPLFRQLRIGRGGKLFYLYKIRTMRDVEGLTSTVTTETDPRITRLGRWLRRWKMDELPQLFNVIRGDMSLVGPRPEVPAYLDLIRREAPLILNVRPGITGPATLKYRHEEELLAQQKDPQRFNDRSLFPDKMRINELYVQNYRFLNDVRFVLQTVISGENGKVANSNAASVPSNNSDCRIITAKLTRTSWPTWPLCDAEQRAAADRVLRSGKLNYWTGGEGRAFEHEFAEYIGCEYAVALANGTVALELALWALGIGPSDEVIVPSRTFVASASAIVRCGAIPVFADVDRDSQNISAKTIGQVVSPRTRAVIAVHLAGWPCDMDPILELARHHDFRVIEDCAQAHGARYKGRPVGSCGDVGAFSFCQDKIMTTAGEGGMLVTNDRDLWERAWSFKDHGKNYEAAMRPAASNSFRWLHDRVGTNWRLTEVQSAIGRVALRNLESWVAKRRRNAQILGDCLSAVPLLTIPQPTVDCYHSYYKYYGFVRHELLDEGWTRDRIVDEINRAGVPCFVGSCSEVYLEKAFDASNWLPRRRPVAHELGETSLMFLVHPTLEEAHVRQFAETARAVLTTATKKALCDIPLAA
jgi:dTDP-4-amino-4,6-dideoxygalactose transaminase/lipopolysaccharide/colanic/teichoic acid biosynthesis glycosyltransferase